MTAPHGAGHPPLRDLLEKQIQRIDELIETINRNSNVETALSFLIIGLTATQVALFGYLNNDLPIMLIFQIAGSFLSFSFFIAGFLQLTGYMNFVKVFRNPFNPKKWGKNEMLICKTFPSPTLS